MGEPTHPVPEDKNAAQDLVPVVAASEAGGPHWLEWIGAKIGDGAGGLVDAVMFTHFTLFPDQV